MIVIFLAALLLLLTACRNDLPVPQSGEVQFSVQGKLDGQSWQLQAGIEDYYLDTDYDTDADGVREFWGHFRPVDCKDCRENLRIVVRDYKATSDPVELDSVFSDPFFLYRGEVAEPDGQTFRFRGHSDGQAPFSYEWDFGDGNSSTLAEPKHQYSGDKAYTVSVRIQDATGCYDESRHEVNTGSRFNNCDMQFTSQILPGGTVQFGLSNPLAAPNFALVFWDFGDGEIIVNDFAPGHTYNLPGIYEVKMILLSESGQYCCDIKNIFTVAGPSCASHIAYRSATPSPDLRRIYIEYTDALGQRYTTDHFEGQPDDSFFELLDRKPYQNDPDGQSTVQLDVRFQCRLYQQGNESVYLDLHDATARFAVAHP